MGARLVAEEILLGSKTPIPESHSGIVDLRQISQTSSELVSDLLVSVNENAQAAFLPSTEQKVVSTTKTTVSSTSWATLISFDSVCPVPYGALLSAEADLEITGVPVGNPGSVSFRWQDVTNSSTLRKVTVVLAEDERVVVPVAVLQDSVARGKTQYDFQIRIEVASTTAAIYGGSDLGTVAHLRQENRRG